MSISVHRSLCLSISVPISLRRSLSISIHRSLSISVYRSLCLSISVHRFLSILTHRSLSPLLSALSAFFKPFKSPFLILFLCVSSLVIHVVDRERENTYVEAVEQRLHHVFQLFNLLGRLKKGRQSTSDGNRRACWLRIRTMAAAGGVEMQLVR